MTLDWHEQHRQKQRAYDQAYRNRKRETDPEWAEKRAEQKKQQRAYYARKKIDPEWRAKRAEGQRKSDAKHRDRKRKSLCEWRKNNPERVKELKRQNRGQAIQADAVKYLLRRLKHAANGKGIPFDLDASDFGSLPTHCPVLGIPIVFPAPLHTHGLPSFDRIDPSKGYIKGNVKIISWRANRLKVDCASPAELRAVADYIERARG